MAAPDTFLTNTPVRPKLPNAAQVRGYARAGDRGRIADARLSTQRFIEGDDFTIADIALGAYARRWFGVEGVNKPKFAHLDRWFAQFASRPGFQQFVAPPMS